MTTLYTMLGIIAGLVALFLAATKLGKTKERLNRAEDNAHDMEEDAAIAAMPYIDNPVGSMRPPKK